jgi:hypothetical protein
MSIFFIMVEKWGEVCNLKLYNKLAVSLEVSKMAEIQLLPGIINPVNNLLGIQLLPSIINPKC